MCYTDNMALITVAQAAERLGVSRQRMHQLIKSYDLQVVEVGQRLFMLDEKQLEKVKDRRPGRPWRKHNKRVNNS